MAREMVTIDANTGAATIAHALNEVIAIYPITPSSSMGELADELSAQGKVNIWGQQNLYFGGVNAVAPGLGACADPRRGGSTRRLVLR